MSHSMGSTGVGGMSADMTTRCSGSVRRVSGDRLVINETPSDQGSRPTQQPRRQVGIFGGTFDPPHLGHLVVAEHLRDELLLDEVRFVVANDPWQKSGTQIVTSAADRLAMVKVAVGTPNRGLVASDVELMAGGPSYTIDTLRTFRAAEPDVDWSVIVGADAAEGLDTWHRASELRDLADIIVVNRPGSAKANAPAGWRARSVEVPPIAISSTAIRSRVADGSSIRFLTPDDVITLIEELGIYRQGS